MNVVPDRDLNLICSVVSPVGTLLPNTGQRIIIFGMTSLADAPESAPTNQGNKIHAKSIIHTMINHIAARPKPRLIRGALFNGLETLSQFS